MMSNWITRKETKAVDVGGVIVGGKKPISIQSMTNTNTCLLYTSPSPRD